MTHLLFLQRDHATVHKRRPLFTGAGHHHRHRVHRHHHGRHLLPENLPRHGLRHREHWRSAHHHLAPRPERHSLPRPLDLQAPHDCLRRLRLPTPDPHGHLPHHLGLPNLGHHDPLNHPCPPNHLDLPHHLSLPNHRGRRDRP